MSYPVILLFGGTSDERRVSVASAQNVAEHLPEAKPWFLAPDGAIHVCTREELRSHQQPFERDFTPSSSPEFRDTRRALDSAVSLRPVFFLALHGGEGENGTLQGELEARRIAFTGSGSAASRRAFDKNEAKRIARAQPGVRLAADATIQTADGEGARQTLRRFLELNHALILKPVSNGSSIGVHKVRSPQELERVLAELSRGPDTAYLAETLVQGRELTIGVHQDQDHSYALPPSEVRVAPDHDFDYEGKYLGRGSQEITPAEIPDSATRASQQLALRMHAALGCEGYSRTDAILTPDGGIVYLETNTLPGLTRASFIPQQLAAAGVPFAEFLRAQLEYGLARSRRG
jgi:D-alanine-D-alanine ligase